MSAAPDTRAGRGGWRHMALAFGLGGVAALGLAPFDWWVLSIPAFAGLLALAAHARRVGWTLWAGGIGYFAVALHWIVEPFLVDAARHGWMAPFALALMAGGMALFWGVAGWLAARQVARPVSFVWMAAGFLVLAEAARATVLTGFPWAHPGHVLIGSEMLAASAFVGPHGLTALVLGAAALVAGVAIARGARLAGFVALACMVPGALPLAPSAPEAGAAAPVIRLIQPNAPQHLKWQADMVPVFFARGLDLTAAQPDPALGAPDLVVWPETSLPVLLGRSDEVRAAMAEAAGDAAMLVGAQRFEGLRPRNTLAVLAPGGAIVDVYHKHHLAPFGEYLPFGDALARIGLRGLAEQLRGGYAPGPGPRLLDPGGLGTVFPMICYEAAFPGYIRTVARPDWMAHLTNDAWFGTFSGPFQHLALARLRAAEQGVPVLRAANTGITAVIDARGVVLQALPLGVAGHLDARRPPPLPPTIYARLGDLPVFMVVLAGLGALALRARAAGPLRIGR